MKITLNKLRQYVDLPTEVEDVVNLLEDVGLEVKRQEIKECDTLLNLELLANRGDHHCYEGIAREINGRTGTGIRSAELETFSRNLEEVPVEVLTPHCLGYSIAEFALASNEVSQLPDLDQGALEAFGYNSVSPIVDATNLVSLEVGQPLHAFDAAKIVGRIVVRLSTEGETAQPLFFESPVELPSETLVIADDEKVLAIAGVIGCESSKPEPETELVWVESATFDPVKVRIAARALGLSTSASMRFERGADPEARERGLDRLNAIAKELGWNATGKSSSKKVSDLECRTLKLALNGVEKFFGDKLEQDEVVSRLSRYGFSTKPNTNGETISVRVPSYRYWDVNSVEDLYEELAKSIGYNSLPDFLPVASPSLPDSSREARRKVDTILTSHGFFEVFTDGFYGNRQRSLLPSSAEWHKNNHVSVINSEDKGFSLLKNNCVIQLAELVKENLNFKANVVRAYEWATRFSPVETGDKKPAEISVLCGIAICSEDNVRWSRGSTEMNLYGIKGVLDQISDFGHWEFRFDPFNTSYADFPRERYLLHSNRSAVIRSRGRNIGVLGEIHPEISHALKLKGIRAYYFEILADTFSEYGPDNEYQEPQNSLPNERDMTLLVPKGVASEEIAAYLKNSGDEVKQVSLVDVFQRNDCTELSLTYRIFLSSDIGRVEAADFVLQLTDSVIQEFSIKGVQRPQS